MIRLPRPLAPRSSRRARPRLRAPSAALRWSHQGTSYQVSLWPECHFARHDGFRWRRFEPTDDVLAAAALSVSRAAWDRYLEFVPVAEREFLQRFRFGRIHALRVLVQCAPLFADLQETPALTTFLAAHASLRGDAGPRWAEVTARHERGGIFPVLEWLGLPAERATLDALRNLLDPDLPPRLLAPLRTSLWNPGATDLLRTATPVSDRRLGQLWLASAA